VQRCSHVATLDREAVELFDHPRSAVDDDLGSGRLKGFDGLVI
jgi:hypothetical protein